MVDDNVKDFCDVVGLVLWGVNDVVVSGEDVCISYFCCYSCFLLKCFNHSGEVARDVGVIGEYINVTG